MFRQVRDAKRPIALPTPAQEAIEALANLRVHRLQTDQDIAEELRAEQAKQRKLLRRNTLKTVGLGVGLLLACTLVAVLMSLPMQTVRFFGIMSVFVLAMSMVMGMISAIFARRHPQNICRDLDVALVALAQKDYENEHIERFFKSSFRSMKPLTEDSFSWARTTSEVQNWPELAEIWTDWLLGDKPVRHRDARDLTDTATKMEKAKEWAAQVGIQEQEGDAFQVEKRAQALQQLPSELVAARREKLLGPQLSEPATPAPARPRF